MAKRILVSDVLDLVAKAETKKEKFEVLRKHNTLELRDVLKGAFDDTVQFILPKGQPPIDENEKKKYDKTHLVHETKKFRYFVKGGPGEQVNALRRERMFIDILYRIETKEAVLICKMKDKELDGVYKGLTKKLVQEAFPGLIFK
jgi:Family of unknown function (DUF6433)